MRTIPTGPRQRSTQAKPRTGSLRPTSFASEVRGVVRAPAPLVGGMLRVRTERTRARRGAVAHLRGNEALRRLAVLDPVDDRRRPVDVVGTRTAGAVQHAGHHEEARVVADRRV